MTWGAQSIESTLNSCVNYNPSALLLFVSLTISGDGSKCKGNEEDLQGPLEFIGIETLILFAQHRVRGAFFTQAVLLCKHLGTTHCFMDIKVYDHMGINYLSQNGDYKQQFLI